MDIDNAIKTAGSACFAVDPASLHRLEANDGAVFSCRKGSRAFVIKFIKSTRGEIARFEERLAFVQYLANNGVPVAAPLPSETGSLFEIVPAPAPGGESPTNAGEEACYLVTLTPRAAGRNPTARNLYDWNDRFFQQWGQVMGQMHALARQYPKWEKPGAQPTCLLDWAEEYQAVLPLCEEQKVLERWANLYETLQSLPRHRANYGLVHNDLHQWNLFYDPDAREGSPVTVLDFDVCSYHWFMNDIAIALYHALMDGSPANLQKRQLNARKFLGPFLRGYTQHNELDHQELPLLLTFLNYREIFSYVTLSHSWPKEKRGKWQNDFLTAKRRRILSGEPVLGALY